MAKVEDSVQDERVNMRFWVRGYSVPSATVIFAVNRRAGANAVEVSKSIHEIMPAIRQRASRLNSHHADLRSLADTLCTR